jgi:hypothetical protein
VHNIDLQVGDDDILVLKIDLSKGQYLTNSGRSVMIATSRGNLLLWRDGKPDPRQIRVNCSVFRPLTAEERRQLEEEKKKQNRYR